MFLSRTPSGSSSSDDQEAADTIVTLVSRAPAVSRTRSRLDAAEHNDILATSRIGIGGELEFQLALFDFAAVE